MLRSITSSSVFQFTTKAIEIFKSPHLTISMYGDAECSKIYDSFVRRHKKFPLVPNKYFGAALIRLSGRPQELFSGGSFEQVRRKFRGARKAGYVHEVLPASEFVPDILAINRSQPARQGRPIQADYLDETLVRQFCDRAAQVHGVLAADGQLAAYAHVPVCGDVAILSRLLGHADHLKSGVMYLLVNEVIMALSRQSEEIGNPCWLQYDMYLGARPGLTQFKRSMGFKPYRVTWQWISEGGRST